MIEKLSEYRIKSRDGGAFINVECNTKIINTLVQKINELVDAVNELQLSIKPILEERKSEIKVHEEAQNMYDNAILDALKDKQVDVVVEPADPYAEQRKWIGKLCRFWDTNIGENVWGILGGIDFSENEKYPYWCDQLEEQYQNCEPVKPDDNVIYKGGKDE